MRGIKPPDLKQTGAAIFVEISGRRSDGVKAVLDAIQGVVLNAYGGYPELISDVGSAATCCADAATHDALSGNYERLKTVRRDLYDRILMNVQWAFCPLCSHREAATVDHYLPRDAFPEFSILPENLVPCCETCNGMKGREYEAGGEALYLHPYFDDIDAFDPVLSAAIVVHDGVADIAYDVSAPPGMPGVTFAKLESQFRELDLPRTYRLNGVMLLAEKTALVAEYLESGVGPKAVARFLEAEARQAVVVYGKNHWRSVALFAMARSRAFCAGGTVVWDGA